MGGWELIIALFGGAWYVISAITAANEKKKKKAQRKLALQAEDLASKPTTESTRNPLNPTTAKETSLSPKRVSEPLPIRETKLDVGLASAQAKPVPKATAGPQQTNIMREARKAILESMRKELGLPTQPTKQPTASSPSLKVPPATPSKPVVRAARPAATQQEPPPPRRPRASVAPKSASMGQESPSGKELAGILKSRGGLKQAMVLSEIFQPPVSLRGQHLS